MNTRILFFALWSLPFWADAQNVIPNASFESWNTTAPSGWTTNNSGVITTLTQVTDSREGLYAIRGTVVQGVNTVSQSPMLQSIYGNVGFPVDESFTEISLYYKTFLWGGDHFNVNVQIFDPGYNLVGGGTASLSGILPDYTPVTIPITHFAPGAAFANIMLTIADPTGQTNGHIQSWFQVDNITGPEMSTGVHSTCLATTDTWATCKDGTVRLVADRAGSYRVQAMSITGQELFTTESTLLKGERLAMPMRTSSDYHGIILLRTERDGVVVKTIRQII
ncbi:MAG: hypothetical protein ACKO1U_05165 [Bacteroidota bacterium]